MNNINSYWERRLNDLVYSYNNCANNYFEPEIFRINLNSFLQTARTVTFIIQKHKNDILNFDDWYANNVLKVIREDPIMEWAKNSRNKIEKQGDLEINSLAKATLIFSYIEDEDVELTGCNSLINLGVEKIIRFARRRMSTALLNTSVIKVERSWMAKDLPNIELLYALSNIYSRLYNICKALTDYMHLEFNTNIPNPSTLNNLGLKGRYIRYIKMIDMKDYSVFSSSIRYDKDINIPENIKLKLKDAKDFLDTKHTLEQIVEYHARLAKNMFEESSYHISVIFLLDNQNRIIEMQGFEPNDQAEKFIFWRLIADKVYLLQAKSLIFICESWMRKLVNNSYTIISKMPVIGEKLSVVGVSGKDYYSIDWDVVTHPIKGQKILINENASNSSRGNFYLLPVIKAMEKINKNNNP